jgi:HPt (histidine-containing phosphotransfer) domain-containing protein
MQVAARDADCIVRENVSLDPFDGPIPDSNVILDLETLGKLASIMPHDKLVMLASSYLSGLLARGIRIDALMETGDLVMLGREGHDLKSTSGSFGARRLQSLGETLETVCRDQDVEAARMIVAAIAVALPDTIEATLRHYPEIRLDAMDGDRR